MKWQIDIEQDEDFVYVQVSCADTGEIKEQRLSKHNNPRTTKTQLGDLILRSEMSGAWCCGRLIV